MHKLFRFSSPLFALLVCAPSLLAQTAAPVPQKTAAEIRAQARPVLRPPASTQSKPAARVSTAESGLHSKPALTSLPALPQARGGPVRVRPATPARTGHWILLYRRSACLPCDQVTNALAASTNPGFRNGQSYTFVVGGKEVDPAAAVRVRYDTLSAATWVADTDGSYYKALNARGAPMLYAMDGDRVAWQVPGTLGDPAALEKRATEWLNAATQTAPVESGPIAIATPVLAGSVRN